MTTPYYADDAVTLESEIERRRRLSREASSRSRARKRGEDVPFKAQDRSRPKSPEHRARISEALRGSGHPNWAGNAVSERGGRARALRAYPESTPCENCGAPESERHHIDANTANNAPTNIARLCRRCHMATDGRLERVRYATPYGGC